MSALFRPPLATVQERPLDAETDLSVPERHRRLILNYSTNHKVEKRSDYQQYGRSQEQQRGGGVPVHAAAEGQASPHSAGRIRETPYDSDDLVQPWAIRRNHFESNTGPPSQRIRRSPSEVDEVSAAPARPGHTINDNLFPASQRTRRCSVTFLTSKLTSVQKGERDTTSRTRYTKQKQVLAADDWR
ncbi:hypothetical protein AAFF_G00191380 [Aldrovandia affinis]|uniref:Uncharacterized protein n=1 Tax=Aldrovandia affinis TaxID=143900 RepID=A0AAD7RJA4_9TELE|nr:hypothetical protein AAFF_G00191380 [Aldrovandia affinis]